MTKEVITKIKNTLRQVDKRILIALGTLIVLTIVITIISLDPSSKNPLLELIFDPDKPIAFTENGKYGYLDSKGRILIEPIYNTANTFYGDYALVSIESEGENRYKIIDAHGQIIKGSESSNKPRYYTDYGVWLIDNALYSYEMKEIFKEDCHVTYSDMGYFVFLSNQNESSGIIDYTGKKIFTWDENYLAFDISKIEYPGSEHYAAISNYEEREEIISLKNGKTIYSLEDPKNQYLEVENDNVFRIIDRENNYKTIKWLYFENSKIAFESEDEIYDITIDDYKQDILKIDYGINYESLGHDERYAYYDVANSKYLESNYDAEENASRNDWMEEIYGYKIYSCDDLYGLMSKDAVLKDCTHTNINFLNVSLYEYMAQYHKKYLSIIQDGTDVTIFDLKSKKDVQTYELASLEETSGSSFLLITNYDDDGFTKKSYTLYNLITAKRAEFDASARITVYPNYVTVTDDGKTTYYNTNLVNIYETSV